MTRTQRQRERCELARRLFIERVRRCPLYRADTVAIDLGGEEGRLPKLHADVIASGAAWGQVADLGDSQIIFLDRAVPVPSRRGVVPVQAADLDFDELIPPWADRAAGHFSYAHTRQAHKDAFSHTNNPLSNHADWTGDANGADWKSDGSQLKPNIPGAGRGQRYRLTGYTPGSADYSTEATVLCVYEAAGAKVQRIHIALRMDAVGNRYEALILPGAAWAFHIWEYSAGAGKSLASKAIAANTYLVRIEAVGTTLKAYLDGTEELSASDGTLPNAESAGFVSYLSAGADGTAYGDNFTTCEEAVRRPAALVGPLAGRAQVGHALAR